MASSKQPMPPVLVTLFFWRALDLEGGAGLVAGVVHELVRCGHRVQLLLPSTPSWLPADVEVVAYGAAGPVRTLLRFLRALRRESERAQVAILLENNPLWHLLVSAALSPGARIAVHISSPLVGNEVFSAGLRRQFVLHWLGKSRIAAKVVAGLVGFRSPVYVVSSRFQAEELVRIGCPRERARVVPFGVEPERFVPRDRAVERADALSVGYLGHLSPIKGVGDLIAAFERAATRRPGMRLRLAWSGKGSEAHSVLRQIEASAVREKVDLLGRVDVAEFLGGVDIVVLPFRSGSIPHFPLVLLEAFAMGVPVVTTAVGGLNEAVESGRTGFVVPVGDVEAMAEALVTLNDRPELRRAMRRTLLAESRERFSTASFCAALLASHDLAPEGSLPR